jgi:WD40 repeat protein/tetratricopeptide (TPR) repeat protein
MTRCPPIDRLSALIRGELSEAEGSSLGDHLESCEPCRSRVRGLSGWALSQAGRAFDSATASGGPSREWLDELARFSTFDFTGEHGRPALHRTTDSPQSGLPAELPGFRQICEAGRGGMGTVYRAVQVGLDRLVALKVLSAGRAPDPDELARFQREILALARLHHPNVVRIYDVGDHEGVPFLVMEWIEGGDLSRRLREGPLPVREAAEIARPLARALQAAHDRGIIHRDLKPGNILLANDDGDSSGASARLTPKVGDFGLAKLVEDGEGSLTANGMALGTPGYMAPEQTGLVGSVPQGPASDIYGLGAVLYEMLVGRPPFSGGSRAETIHQVIAGDIVPPRRLRPAVPRDLETICLKCLERDPGRRYPTALALADDFERFLDGRPIRARRVRAWEHAVRWRRRKPAEARLVMALILAVVVGFASVTWLWRRAGAEARRAIIAAAAESRLRALAQAEVATRDLDQGIALAQHGDIDHGLLLMAQALREAPQGHPELTRITRASLAGWADCTFPLRAILEHQGTVMRALYCDQGRSILTGSRDGTARFWDAVTGRPLRPPFEHGDQVMWVALSPDGRRVATAGANRTARLWDAETGRPVGTPIFLTEPALWVVFSPDGRLLATCDNGPVRWRLWDADTGRPFKGLTYGASVLDLRFTADGRSVAIGSASGVTQFWNISDGRYAGPEMKFDSPVTRVLVGPNPRRIATGHADGSARVWDPTIGRAIGTSIPDGLPMSFSPDGRSLLVVDSRGQARLWNLAAGRDLGFNFADPPGVGCGAFSPDGRLLLTGCGDHNARLWEAATGRAIGPPLRHRLNVRDVEFAADGRSFFTSSEDGTVKIWGLESLGATPSGPEPEKSESGPRPAMPRRAGGVVFEQALVAADRTRMALRSESDGLVRTIATSDGQPIGPPLAHCWPRVGAAAISPGGDRIATSGFDRPGSPLGSTASICQIFDSATSGPTTPVLPHANWPARLAFSPDGRTLASGDFDGGVHLWDVANGQPMGPPLRAGSIVQSLAYSPDGRLLAAGTAEIVQQVVLWDLATRRPRGEPVPFKHWVNRIAFSPDSSRLAAGSRDATVRLIDTATGRAIGEPLRLSGSVATVGFSPDGRTLLTATHGAPEASVIKFWSAVDGRPRPASIILPAIALDLAVAPDGTQFAAGCADGSVSLWDVATARQVGPARVLRGRIIGLAFSPDGASLLAADARGNLANWPVPRSAPEPPDRLIQSVRARTGVELDTTGRLGVLDATAWRHLFGEESAEGRRTAPSQHPEWNENCARDAEAAGDSFAAIWHLDRLIAARPDDGLLHARRALARLRAEDGDAALARSDLDHALELGPRDRIVDWLAHRACDLLASGRASGALLMLDRALAARPEDWRLPALRAEALGALARWAEHDAEQARAVKGGADISALMQFGEERARAGRYREAALLFDQATARGEVPYEVWEWAALDHLAAGDEDGYRRTCALLRSRYPAALSVRQAAQELAHVCTLGPGGLGDDDHKVLTWATGSFRQTGAVHFRAGRYREAVTSIRQKIAEADEQAGPADAAFLAMALHGSGEKAAARATLRRSPRPRDPDTGMLNRQQQSSDQLTREAERILFGEPLPENVFAP